MTTIARPTRRVTADTLGHSFLADHDRRLIVSLERPDLLVMWPQGLRRSLHAQTIALKDVYRFVIRSRADHAKMEGLRDKKAKKAEQRKQRAWNREVAKANREVA